MARKIVFALLLSAAVSIGGYFLYRRYRQNQAIANDPTNDGKGYLRASERTWDITKATAIGLGDGFTGTFSIKRGGTFPMLKDSQESWTAKDREKNKAAIEALVSKYNAIVDDISNLCLVPRWLIYGIMAVENPAGNPAAQIRADKATGLMMVTPPTANDTIRIAVRKGLLKDEHKEILTEKIGSTDTQALLKDKYGVTNHITANDLKDETLNLMVGAAKLSNLIDKYGTEALHKVLACFNQGDYYLQTKGYADYSLAKLYATTGPHRDYLQKTIGKDGSMDIIVNDLNILN
jgi:hypothetical protein